MNIDAVVFDLDGVLIDSKNCMRECWRSVQSDLNISIPFEDYFLYIGRPFKNILYNLELPFNIWARAENIYFEAQRKFIDRIEIYEGIDDLLKLLRNKYILGVVTSKNSVAVNNIIMKFGWEFAQVITPENCVRGKPYPDPLLYFAAYEQLDPGKCIYVGDMVVDSEAAELAGFKFIRAAWGYQDFISPSADSPEILFQMIEDLS
jgi:HAD superfamily hydrolase (TIGR01549 family)